MNFISVLFCLGALLGAAWSQYPDHCYSPALMTGAITVMAGDGLLLSSGKIIYDGYGQKIRTSKIGTVGNVTYGFDHLMFVGQRYYYDIDWTTQTCKKLPLDADFFFHPMQVPPDAKFDYQMVLGSSSSPGMGLLSNSWVGRLPDGGSYQALYSQFGCIPLTFSVYTPKSGLTTVSTYNWVVGITNPMDLLPPAFCHGAQLEETEKPQTFFSTLESLARKVKSVE